MTRHISKYLLLIGTTLFSLSAATFEKNEVKTAHIAIPIIENAHVFAELTDDIPAVLNYYTTAQEEVISAFYQKSYGEPISNQRHREHLTLVYQISQQTIRVIISQQNNKRQVDIIVEEVKNHS